MGNREKAVNVRLSPGEYQRIKSQAERLGLAMAEYMRMLAMRAAYNEGPIKED